MIISHWLSVKYRYYIVTFKINLPVATNFHWLVSMGVFLHILIFLVNQPKLTVSTVEPQLSRFLVNRTMEMTSIMEVTVLLG